MRPILGSVWSARTIVLCGKSQIIVITALQCPERRWAVSERTAGCWWQRATASLVDDRPGYGHLITGRYFREGIIPRALSSNVKQDLRDPPMHDK
ncbi:hypothetical protein RRG08_006673 [Elysia crispata]|uniref:Uncharacterized protein n=1 Tax=Elysia crispata TaxID=231223 RepID=A0AAE1D6C9_9GAST|nr:hypothetical protein RRG08_006673 [Elysia crispata]